jgi:hypothetical protein
VVGPVADLWGVAPVFIGSALLVVGVWVAGRGVRRSSLVGRSIANVPRDT